MSWRHAGAGRGPGSHTGAVAVRVASLPPRNRHHTDEGDEHDRSGQTRIADKVPRALKHAEPPRSHDDGPHQRSVYVKEAELS
jgi:hypothetical protein